MEFKEIVQLWPIAVFIMGLLWKQISTHFDVQSLKKDASLRDMAIDHLEEDFEKSLKDHALSNKINIDKLTDAVTELVKVTTVLSTKIELNEKRRGNERS